MPEQKITYLGDSVYVEMDKYGDVVLFLNNGERIAGEMLRKNPIVLDSNTISNLSEFLARQYGDR